MSAKGVIAAATGGSETDHHRDQGISRPVDVA
jgi:hypothetical protein